MTLGTQEELSKNLRISVTFACFKQRSTRGDNETILTETTLAGKQSKKTLEQY
jgi:hypothetical protein